MRYMGRIKNIKENYIDSKIRIFFDSERNNDENEKCPICNKTFKNIEFIRKHIGTKHLIDMKKIFKEIYFKEYFMTYSRDDMKIDREKEIKSWKKNK